MDNTSIIIIVIASCASFMLGMRKAKSNCFCLSCSFERDDESNALKGIHIGKKQRIKIVPTVIDETECKDMAEGEVITSTAKTSVGLI